MEDSLKKFLQGYKDFREKYVHGDRDIMQHLHYHGQQPQAMVVACCDSRADPALILQCDPGDLFVVRNVANIVPPYEKDEAHHGTSAALEFGICFLQVQHLILLGHSQCGGIQALLQSANQATTPHNDFINNWVSVIKNSADNLCDVDECARQALQQSYQNCLTFPWVRARLAAKLLQIHLWFFDIKTGQIFTCASGHDNYVPLMEAYSAL